jgi:hypothetical protein
LVPLSDEQRREAVGLLAQLLLDAALKREGAGEAPKTKALLRLLIQELRVDGRAQIRPTYRSRPRFAQRPKKWSVPGSNR